MKVKQLDRQADLSSPYNVWSFTSRPLFVFMAWCAGTGITLLLYVSNKSFSRQICGYVISGG